MTDPVFVYLLVELTLYAKCRFISVNNLGR